MLKFNEFAFQRDIKETYNLLPKIGVNPNLFLDYLCQYPDLLNESPESVLAQYNEINWSAGGVGSALGAGAGAALGSLAGPVGSWTGAKLGAVGGGLLGGLAGNYANRLRSGAKGWYNKLQMRHLMSLGSQLDLGKYPDLQRRMQQVKANQKNIGWEQSWKQAETQELLSQISSLLPPEEQEEPAAAPAAKTQRTVNSKILLHQLATLDSGKLSGFIQALQGILNSRAGAKPRLAPPPATPASTSTNPAATHSATATGTHDSYGWL